MFVNKLVRKLVSFFLTVFFVPCVTTKSVGNYKTVIYNNGVRVYYIPTQNFKEEIKKIDEILNNEDWTNSTGFQLKCLLVGILSGITSFFCLPKNWNCWLALGCAGISTVPTILNYISSKSERVKFAKAASPPIYFSLHSWEPGNDRDWIIDLKCNYFKEMIRMNRSNDKCARLITSGDGLAVIVITSEEQRKVIFSDNPSWMTQRRLAGGPNWEQGDEGMDYNHSEENYLVNHIGIKTQKFGIYFGN